MNLTDKKLIILLWTVIGVLVAGFVIGAILVLGHIKAVEQSGTNMIGDNESLKRQVDQLRAERNATPSPLPSPEPTEVPTPRPASSR